MYRLKHLLLSQINRQARKNSEKKLRGIQQYTHTRLILTHKMAHADSIARTYSYMHACTHKHIDTRTKFLSKKKN